MVGGHLSAIRCCDRRSSSISCAERRCALVRGTTVTHGYERSPAVTDASEESQVAGPPACATAMTQGRFGLWSRRPGLGASGQQPGAVGINTTVEETWPIVGGLGR